jgi:N-acetylneuraminate synthase
MLRWNSQLETLVVAEAGVNHNGSLDRAVEMVDVAAQAGADIVKFQTFKAERVVSRNAPKADYQRRTTASGESQLEMARKLELNTSAHRTLLERCRERGIEFLSSPFDMPSLDLLARTLDVARIKIASGEITDFPLLLAAARCGKRLILSSGMSTLGEIESALGVIAFGLVSSATPSGNSAQFREAFSSPEGQNALRERVSLLHCTTDYPADFADVNLKAMHTMQEAFGLPVGLSDHTPGIAICVAAVARGAAIIEKHFTLDKTLPGPDHAASLDPAELSAMVRSIRQVEQALGNGIKCPTSAEKRNLAIVRRSLTAARRIAAGEELTAENLTTKRPGDGVSAVSYWSYIGRAANRSYQEDEQIDE